MPSDRWYKDNENERIWWLDNSDQVRGVFIFSFDKKEKFNLFTDYPHKLTEEQKRIFDEDNPFWMNFFKGRKGTKD